MRDLVVRICKAMQHAARGATESHTESRPCYRTRALTESVIVFTPDELSESAFDAVEDYRGAVEEPYLSSFSIRLALPQDEIFLYNLDSPVRAPEFELAPIPATQKELRIRIQF